MYRLSMFVYMQNVFIQIEKPENHFPSFPFSKAEQKASTENV